MAHPIMSSATMTGPDTEYTLPVLDSFSELGGAIFALNTGRFVDGGGGASSRTTGAGAVAFLLLGVGGGVELARWILVKVGELGSGI
jgi:hypothetical protein